MLNNEVRVMMEKGLVVVVEWVFVGLGSVVEISVVVMVCRGDSVRRDVLFVTT